MAGIIHIVCANGPILGKRVNAICGLGMVPREIQSSWDVSDCDERDGFKLERFRSERYCLRCLPPKRLLHKKADLIFGVIAGKS